MPTIAEALAIGFQHHQAGQLPQAEQIYRQILAQQPSYPNALHLLGMLALQTGRPLEAVSLIEQAIAVDPAQAVFHGDLGSAYLVVGRHEDALASLKQAIARDPLYPDPHYNEGVLHYHFGRLEAAMACYRRCLELRPDHFLSHVNLGVIYQDLFRLAEAQQHYERALELQPGSAVAHYNLGSVLKIQGQLAAAVECYDKAIAIDPNYPHAIASRAVVSLTLGDLAGGWAGYEFRVGVPPFDTMTFPQPRWDGSPLGDRTLLIHCEQGLGDTLQFIRYLKMAQERGGKVIVAVQPSLIPLLSQSGFRGLVSKKDPLPAFDVHVPLLSLPHVFGTVLETVPADIPYLVAEPERIAKWRKHFEPYTGLKVGITWQGGKTYKADRIRSIPLASFAPLAGVPGVQLFSLQKGPGCEQIPANAEKLSMVDLGPLLDNDGGAFLDTAAVIQNLDLIVVCDTAIGHLAGALGARVWLALTRDSEWRWMLDRTDSPWYPTVRLFRQRQFGDWDQVFRDMTAELARLV